MKKPLLITVIVLLALGVGAWVLFKGKRYEIVITQQDIDTALTDKFPASKDYLVLFTVTYSDPQVTLLEGDDRVQVGLDAALNFRLKDEPSDLGGGATVTSGLRYEPETRQFFLDDAQIDRLEIAGIPDKWLEKVSEVATRAAKEIIESKPIYTLEAKDARTAAAGLLLKDVEVREQAIHVSLGL